MRFKLYTLVDITETLSRRGDNVKSVRQQQNFLTVLQTIGLRANPTYKHSPSVESVLPKTYRLGSTYTKKQNIWTFEFEIEAEDAHSLDLLLEDFDCVPYIGDLDETISTDDRLFITKDSKTNNIYFELVDK